MEAVNTNLLVGIHACESAGVAGLASLACNLLDLGYESAKLIDGLIAFFTSSLGLLAKLPGFVLPDIMLKVVKFVLVKSS